MFRLPRREWHASAARARTQPAGRRAAPAHHIHRGTGDFVAVEDVDSARVTRLPREIDVATRGAAEADLLAAVSAPGLVIADMTGTAICDSAGMRMLVAAHNRARSSGATLRVAVTPGTSVARVMAILGVTRVLSLYDSVDDAQAPCAARPLPLARKPRRPPGP